MPDDWQARLAAAVRGDGDDGVDWLAGTRALSPAAQLDVYRRQYRLRIGDALREEVPGLVHLLDDPTTADALLWRYLDAVPPASWTLNHVAHALPAWMEAAGEAPPLCDMAALDVAVSQVFEAAEGAPPDLAALSGDTRLRLRPCVRLLRLRHNVAWVRAAVLRGEPPPPLAPGDYPTVVFRRGLRVRHAEVEPGAFALLAAFGEGAPLAAALESAGDADPATVGAWFTAFGEAGWLGACGPDAP